MSEPARTLPPIEAGRPAPGPLRDWLAAMKAHAVASEPRQEARSEIREPQKPARPAETAWGPRLVQTEEAPRARPADDSDVSELMAENLMLKAKLRLEDERQDALQALLGEQIRELRQHVDAEMGALQDMRAEQDVLLSERDETRAECERLRADRDAMRAERDRAIADREGSRTEREALAAERDMLREERDLWRARTEALAQPLFQGQRR